MSTTCSAIVHQPVHYRLCRSPVKSLDKRCAFRAQIGALTFAQNTGIVWRQSATSNEDCRGPWENNWQFFRGEIFCPKGKYDPCGSSTSTRPTCTGFIQGVGCNGNKVTKAASSLEPWWSHNSCHSQRHTANGWTLNFTLPTSHTNCDICL